MSNKGWISLHRKIQHHWLWDDKPFSRGQAWIDLLMLVNHEDNKTLLGNELIDVDRGSRVTSIRQLCERWGWSNRKVVNFLNLLESDGMIQRKSDTKKTVISIENYNDYQHDERQKATLKRHECDTRATRTHTNNNDNNENNDNKNISLEIKNFRKRYSEEQLKIIDNYFDILRWTRKHGKIADSVIRNIYKEWEKFNPVIVLYALKVYVENPKHHDKKENYCYGIMRNTTMEEVANKGQGNVRQLAIPSKNFKTKFHLESSRGDKYTADEIEEKLLRKQRKGG